MDSSGTLRIHWWCHLLRWHTEAIAVAEEQHALVFPLGAFARFDPMAHASASPHALQEADRSSLDV